MPYIAEDIQLGDIILGAVRRYDASLPRCVPESAHPDVNKYLVTPLRSYLANGGKRLRPLLCELGCELVGGDPEDASDVAQALEMFHSAALIHDDIEDDSPLRRGLPAYHEIEGVPGSINAGDYGLALAFKAVADASDLPGDVRLRVMGECIDTALRTIEGQAVDIGWARDRRFDVSVRECLFVCEAKSAYYTCAAPLAIGAIVGGGTESQVEALRAIGLDVGVAFQLKDDLLNLTGEEALTGKGSFTDLEEGKRTAIVAHALENSPAAPELQRLLDKGSLFREEISRIMGILDEAGSIAYVQRLMEGMCDKAKASLRSQFPETRAREVTFALVDYVRDRMQ